MNANHKCGYSCGGDIGNIIALLTMAVALVVMGHSCLARHGGRRVTSRDLYCVIDLAPGPNASSYPVSYMSSPPSGGFNTDEYKTEKLVLRRIEPGTFVRGHESDHDSKPHIATLTTPFYCGIFEVTHKQYELVTGADPSDCKNNTESAMCPVVYVSWDTIRGDSKTYEWPGTKKVAPGSFVGRLRARTGFDIDLPTCEQWEYACRAGTTTKYYWGDAMNGDYCWYGDNSDDVSHVVGTKKANAWGLYDMSGSVEEWCLNFWSSWDDRALGGGSWCDDAEDCTSSSWQGSVPSCEGCDTYGFRIVRTLSNWGW